MNNGMADLEEIVANWFAAAEAEDWDMWRSLVADDAELRQNFVPDRVSTADESMAWAKAMADSGVRLAYEDLRRFRAGRQVVEQHVVRLTAPDGTTAATDVCVIIRFDDDNRMVEVDEYLDSAAFRAVFAALRPPSTT